MAVTERALRIANHAVVFFILLVVAYFIRPTMAAVKESAESSTMVSQQALNLEGTATSFIGTAKGHEAATLFGLLFKAGQMVDAGTGTINKAGDTLVGAQDTLNQGSAFLAHAEPTPEMKAKAQALLEAYTSLPGHLNPLLDSTKQTVDDLGETVDTLNRFVIDPKTGQLRDNLSLLALNWAKFGDRAATMTGHIDDKFFKPWDGTHPFKHYVGVGVSLIQPTAGAVALARGN
jgi:hypothetical protein